MARCGREFPREAPRDSSCDGWFVDLEGLKEDPPIPPFQPGALAVADSAPRIESYVPLPPSGMAKLVPGAGKKNARAVEEAKTRFETDLTAYKVRERERTARLDAAQQDYEAMVAGIRAKADAQGREIE